LKTRYYQWKEKKKRKICRPLFESEGKGELKTAATVSVFITEGKREEEERSPLYHDGMEVRKKGGRSTWRENIRQYGSPGPGARRRKRGKDRYRQMRAAFNWSRYDFVVNKKEERRSFLRGQEKRKKEENLQSLAYRLQEYTC